LPRWGEAHSGLIGASRGKIVISPEFALPLGALGTKLEVDEAQADEAA
jgi:hypothetical protein